MWKNKKDIMNTFTKQFTEQDWGTNNS